VLSELFRDDSATHDPDRADKIIARVREVGLARPLAEFIVSNQRMSVPRTGGTYIPQ